MQKRLRLAEENHRHLYSKREVNMDFNQVVTKFSDGYKVKNWH